MVMGGLGAQVDFYEHASSFIHVVLFQPSGAHHQGGPCSQLCSSVGDIPVELCFSAGSTSTHVV